MAATGKTAESVSVLTTLPLVLSDNDIKQLMDCMKKCECAYGDLYELLNEAFLLLTEGEMK